MITYKSKRHPNIFVTSDGEVDPKYKTVLITYSNGKTESISHTTLIRMWEVVEQAEIPNEKTEQVSPAGSITEFIESVAQTMGGTLKTWDSKPNMFAVTYNQRAVMEICVGRHSLKVRVKPDILRTDEEYVAHSYNFGATITLAYDESGYSALESLITRSIVYSSNKPKKSRKHKKEEK